MDRILGNIGNKFIEKYQQHVSGDLADERDYDCRYTPSCSEYTHQAVDQYGLIKGGAMGFMRIMRCHGGAEGGFDPVIAGGGEGDGFVPAHKNYQYESAEKIMAYSKAPAASHHTTKSDEALPEKKSEPQGFRETVKKAWRSSVAGACSVAGGIAGGMLFSLLGAGLGGWLGTAAGRDRIDDVNAKIAKNYSPESVYGFAKIENAVAKPSYLLNKFIEAETGSATAARVAGSFMGGPLGIAVGGFKGFLKGMKTGSQYGRLFGRSLTGRHKAAETTPTAGREGSPAPERDAFTPASSFLKERPLFRVGGTTVAPLVNGDAATAMAELVKEAKTSVDIEIFSIRSEEMVKVLKEKLGEGVKVRIINNPPGRNAEEIEYHKKAIDELKGAGAEVMEYPLFKSAWQFNHTKLIIVDDHAALMGSKNWSDDFRMKKDFDVAFLLTGDTVDEARRIFAGDWKACGGKTPEVAHRDESPGVELQVSEPFRYDAGEAVRKSIREAASSIDVGMYWLTDKEVLGELVEAAEERHVKVRVLLSRSDENRAAKEILERAGVEVRVFSPPGGDGPQRASYHTKMAVFDDRKVVAGSCDWTTQAFYLNHELNIAIDDAGVARHMKEAFLKDWDSFGKKDGDFDRRFEMKGLARVNELQRKISQKLPSSLAKTGMMLAGIVGSAKRLFRSGPAIPGPSEGFSTEAPALRAAGKLSLPELREPIKMQAVSGKGALEATSALTKMELNPMMMGVSGNVLVKNASGGAELTIPEASSIARQVARQLLIGKLDSRSVTEIVIVGDMKEVNALQASPSGKVHRQSGGGVIIDTDPEQPFRRVYLNRNLFSKDRKLPGGLNLSVFRKDDPDKVTIVPVLGKRPLSPPIDKDSSMFCGGLVSISAEPPEGFFAGSTAQEMARAGHKAKPARDADIWLYRVPDTRQQNYFQFTYPSEDRPLDTPREGKFKIATGFGPASNPLSAGTSEADLLWFGDEQHGTLKDYMDTIAKPGLTVEDLYRHQGFVQRLSQNEVLLGSPDLTHTLTKQGFSELETDPRYYRKIYSREYDAFLKGLFRESSGGPPARTSYLLATSRGCSQGCTICCSGGVKSFQFFDGKRIMTELEKIAALEKPKDGEIIDIFFLDSNLNNNAERMIELADLYEKSPLKGKFRFYCRHSSPNGFLTPGENGGKEVNRELVAAYGKLGLKEVVMGIDTYDDNSTLTMKTRRNVVAEKEGETRPTYMAGEIRELIRALEKEGLTSRGFYITNNPWVTDMDRLDSYYHIMALWLENPHFSIDARNREVLQLKPFDGSPITDVAAGMKTKVLEKGRFVARGPLGELDEMMQWSALNDPRARGDAGKAVGQFREGISSIRQKAGEVFNDSSRSAGDRRRAELVIRKMIERDRELSAMMEGLSGAGPASAFLKDARAFAEAYKDLPPFNPADQKSDFLSAAQTLFDGLRRTLPLKMEMPPPAPDPGKPGYRGEIASLDPGDPHTIKDLERYLEDNLGAAAMEAIKSGNEPFVILQGEGSRAFDAMKARGWKVLEKVEKREGFHQVCRVQDGAGKAMYAVVRVNGDDRVLHIQSLLRLAGLPADRLSTAGRYTPVKDDFLKAFESLGHVPDYVVYGMGKTAAAALMTAKPLHNAKELAGVFSGKKPAGGAAPPGKEPAHDLSGLSVHVMELENGKHLWFLPPLYGDLSKDVMAALIEHGAKDITFMGTCGAVNPSYRVGQIATPVERLRPDGSRERLDWLAPSPGATPGTYTRVATPNLETVQWARDTVKIGVDTVEVELGYWLDELKSHPEIKFRVQNVVSDVIQGDHHADMTQWNSLNNVKSMGAIRRSLEKGLGLPPEELRVKSLESRTIC
ncbi:MAG: membrane protein insertion efficiency factor YidD [Candidatus Eremiobacteraeota bacterium]|nr:membrane protein insertion efficiency factor YidD [Candidatus Eremiobacteraeota bacterium]